MIVVRVDTAGEAEAVRRALKAGALGEPFAITYPGGGGEYAQEPAAAGGVPPARWSWHGDRDDVCTCTVAGGLVQVDGAGRCTICRKLFP